MHHCGGALDAAPGQRASGLSTEQSPSPLQRKSWKRRFFVLDEFSISYYKCEQVSSSPRTRALLLCCTGASGEAHPSPGASQAHHCLLSPLQDKEPLRSILLKDVCKTHECLVKSG